MVMGIEPKSPSVTQSFSHILVIECVCFDHFCAQTGELLCLLGLGVTGQCSDNETLLAFQQRPGDGATLGTFNVVSRRPSISLLWG